MTIEIKNTRSLEKSPPCSILARAVKIMNDLVGKQSKTIFFFQEGLSIRFGACSNNHYHNKLIALVTLWFIQNDFPLHGYTSFGTANTFELRETGVEPFIMFLETLPPLNEIVVKIN